MKIMIYAQELLSVVLTPFVLWFSLPDCAPAIVDFFREFTIHVDTLGYVCSFAVFDFKRHGNVKVSTDLGLVPLSSIGPGVFPCLPLSVSSITTPRSMIPSWIFGVLYAWNYTDGLGGNRCVDGEMGLLHITSARKTLRLLLPFMF